MKVSDILKETNLEKYADVKISIRFDKSEEYLDFYYEGHCSDKQGNIEASALVEVDGEGGKIMEDGDDCLVWVRREQLPQVLNLIKLLGGCY